MKILFVHGFPSTFTCTDLKLLKEKHDVRELWFKYNSTDFLKSVFLGVRWAMWAETIFCWFGVFHALIPSIIARLLGRKVVIASCGYDSANMPEIEYGNMRPGIRKYIGRAVYRLANVVLAACEFGKSELIMNVGVPERKIRVIHLGFEPVRYDPMISKRKLVLCIGFIDSSNLKRKGIQTFVQAAKYLPDVEFVLIGKHVDDGAITVLNQMASSNVAMPGFVSDITGLLQLASVIVQVSAHEGFGCAVAEAMLWGCIPVVTKRGSLPEVVGDTGMYVPYGDPRATASGIKKALEMGTKARLSAHARVMRQFSLDLRRQRLYEALDSLSNDLRS